MNLSDLQIQSAEAEMAVGLEWVHLQHLGQSRGLLGVDYNTTVTRGGRQQSGLH